MKVDTTECLGCGECVSYCPMNALSVVNDEHAVVDEEKCVECNICCNSDICPVDALQKTDLQWPRIIRSVFSDPLQSHGGTGVPGRGTEEMKTNDVTGRFRAGHAGIAVELGRPSTGAYFRDVEKVAMAVAKLGVAFEEKNPVTSLMTDQSTGKIRDDVLNEKALSAIVEFDVPLNLVPEALNVIKNVSYQIDTVFSLDLACRVSEQNLLPAAELARENGFELSLNGKTNVGLGRPLAENATEKGGRVS